MSANRACTCAPSKLISAKSLTRPIFIQCCFVSACSFDISVRAGPLDVVHYTIDPEDPSNGVCLSMTMGAWQGNMLMNQPNPRPAPQGASSPEKKR